MRKVILPLTVLIFFICGAQGEAAFCSRVNYNYYLNDIATVTGTVDAIGRNSINVDDELQKRVERFIYFEQMKSLHKGDYVRVYYHPDTGIVQMIKRMTVLEYKKNVQNLGYISH